MSTVLDDVEAEDDLRDPLSVESPTTGATAAVQQEQSSVASSDGLSQVTAEATQFQQTADVEAVDDPSQVPLATTVQFTLPRAVKQRGRPASTRQRTFRAKVAQMTKSGEPSGTKANHDTATDNCAECGMPDPPRVKSRKRVVSWIECEQCAYWYHMCCLNEPPKSKRARYICARCQTV